MRHFCWRSLALPLLLLAVALAALSFAPAPASADLLSDLLGSGILNGAGGAGGGGGSRNQPQRGHARGGGLAARGADTCDAFVCPLAEHSPQAKANWVPLSNGCGSYGFRIHSPWHESCCDAHDKCYSTCGRSRERCDADFQTCMKQSCSRLLPSSSAAASQRDRQAQSECEGQANLFFSATRSMGCQAFLDSQREACHCALVQKAQGAVKDAATATATKAAGAQKIKQHAQDEL